MPRKIIATMSVVASLSVLTLVGCGGGYGTPRTNLNISIGDGAGEVYMIPLPVWEKNNKREMIKSADLMDEWRVGSSPATARPRVDRSYVFVAKDGDSRSNVIIRAVSASDKTLVINYQ